MMRPSRQVLSPVVTLLSPSPGASRRAQEILGSVFGLDEASLGSTAGDDALNAKFQASFPAAAMNWDSVISRCANSGTLVHWLSLENATDSNSDKGAFSLLGVTCRADEKEEDISKGIQQSRGFLASQFPSSTLTLRLRHFLQRPMTADALLQRHQGLPVFNLPEESQSPSAPSNNKDENPCKGPRLKEVAFTMYDDAVYEDGSTVLAQLSQSALLRPVTGLFEWPATTTNTNHSGGGVCLRPLPAAQQDLKGSPRSLVLTFHCESLEEILESNAATNNNNTSTPVQLYKIGFTGQGNGQLRVHASTASNANPLMGLDVRWCERTKPTSAFSEAQESLMASSLPELQSPNVLKSTGKSEPGTDDQRIGSSDCWVEVRTMVQNPRGFASSKGPKVATAPPSYPE